MPIAGGWHSVLKWAVTGGHDSGLIAGADHTLHLLSTLQPGIAFTLFLHSLTG